MGLKLIYKLKNIIEMGKAFGVALQICASPSFREKIDAANGSCNG